MDTQAFEFLKAFIEGDHGESGTQGKGGKVSIGPKIWAAFWMLGHVAPEGLQLLRFLRVTNPPILVEGVVGRPRLVQGQDVLVMREFVNNRKSPCWVTRQNRIASSSKLPYHAFAASWWTWPAKVSATHTFRSGKKFIEVKVREV